MLVTIVAVPNADNTGLDLDRLEKVEDLPDEVARTMLQIGTAREPNDEELGAYEKTQAKDASDSKGERAARPAKKAAAPAETAPVDGEPSTDVAPTDGSEGTAA